jgi:Tol biopolymer transport system component
LKARIYKNKNKNNLKQLKFNLIMTKNLTLLIAIISIAFSSCKTSSYLMIAEGESFDALTRITDEKKICELSSGGDNGKNLVFCCLEEDGFSENIYMKDNVLSSVLIQKTSGSNRNAFPNYCSANDKIVFQYLNKLNYDIYYINAKSGKAITQITNTNEDEFNPCWSSDGKMIVFEKGSAPKSHMTYKANNNEGMIVSENQIWIKNLETGELKMVGQGSYPKFSPDNKLLVYVKYNFNKTTSAETGTIWIMSIEGENPKQITGQDLCNASYPFWSPDAKNIAFQLTKKEKSDFDIYSISVEGENLKQHTTNSSQDFAPYWTIDNYLFFTSDRGNIKGKYSVWRFKINLE